MEATHFESLYPEESRFEEIEKILKYIKEGNSVQLVGLPGTGRSNLLGLLAYNRRAREKHLGEAQSNFHFVWINFSDLKKKPLLDLNKFLFISLIDSLGARGMKGRKTKVEEIFNKSDKNDELLLFQGLKDAITYLALERNLTVVFMMDRFDEYIPMISSEFFTQLRSLRNRAKYKFSAIFALSRPLHETLEENFYSDFSEYFTENIVYLPLRDDPSLNFRIKHLESVSEKKMPKEILNQILELTAGHGKLTRLCIEAYFSEDTDEKLENFLLRKERVKKILFEIWNALNPSEQEYLLTGERSVDISYLESVELIKDEKLTVKLLDLFVQKHKNDLEKGVDVGIIFDKEKDEIKRGEIVLSDLLTSSEFKLLKYLLENPNQVLSRDQIIQGVWGDQASIAGVTDQALDQLIFRLRKKIEEDPNNSRHIQTIKGRGFRFIA